MWNYGPNVAQIARREVAQWFAWREGQSVFLPGDGRVLPLGHEEALAIRASAETKAIEWHVSFQHRAWLAIAIVIFVVVGSQSLASGLAEPWKGGVEAAAYAIYATHGAWMLYEAWAVYKEMRTMRLSIAQALAGRVPLDPIRAGGIGLTDPVRIVLIGIVALLLAWNFVAEHVAIGGGPDLIGWIPPWLLTPFVIFVLIAAYGSRWIDRSRGIGVEPPRDFNARVERALERERRG